MLASLISSKPSYPNLGSEHLMLMPPIDHGSLLPSRIPDSSQDLAHLQPPVVDDNPSSPGGRRPPTTTASSHLGLQQYVQALVDPNKSQGPSVCRAKACRPPFLHAVFYCSPRLIININVEPRNHVPWAKSRRQWHHRPKTTLNEKPPLPVPLPTPGQPRAPDLIKRIVVSAPLRPHHPPPPGAPGRRPQMPRGSVRIKRTVINKKNNIPMPSQVPSSKSQTIAPKPVHVATATRGC